MGMEVGPFNNLSKGISRLGLARLPLENTLYSKSPLSSSKISNRAVFSIFCPAIIKSRHNVKRILKPIDIFLAWCDNLKIGVPETAVTPALIGDDQGAPMGTWVHGVLFNLPAREKNLGEGVPTDQELKNGIQQSRNDLRRISYGGACPPGGTHRYFFMLYALDTALDSPHGASRADLVKTGGVFILAAGKPMAKYRR